MDSVDAMLLMRMVERLLGLLSGALCVVLGYRLFINLPEKTDSSVMGSRAPGRATAGISAVHTDAAKNNVAAVAYATCGPTA